MGAVLTDAAVESEGETLIVRWTFGAGEQAAVDISVGATPETVDHAHVRTVAADTRTARLDGLGAGRHYVSVVPHGGGGAVVVADRRVPFEGVTNFRDLGGYPTSDGRRTRWGRVFRADGLHRFTEGDLARYQSLGLHAVYDLRGDNEREKYPDPVPSVQLSLLAYRTRPDGSMPPPDPALPADFDGGERLLRALYHGMLANAGPLLGRLLSGLADPDGLPAVFHCTGGKDRTGISAAVLLELLGVPRDDVLDDYELTSRYRLREHQSESYQNLLANGLAPEAAAAVLGAPRWAMAETLGTLDSEYGGVERYLTGPAGMQASALDRLRQLLIV